MLSSSHTHQKHQNQYKIFNSFQFNVVHKVSLPPTSQYTSHLLDIFNLLLHGGFTEMWGLRANMPNLGYIFRWNNLVGHLRSFRSCQGQQRSFEVVFGFFHDIFCRTTLYIFDHEEFNSKSIPEAALKISNPVLGSFFSLIASFFTAVSFIFQKDSKK